MMNCMCSDNMKRLVRYINVTNNLGLVHFPNKKVKFSIKFVMNEMMNSFMQMNILLLN